MADRDPYALFVEMTPRRLFFTAAVPGAISMLASALYDVADGILVGQLLGETAFAAVNLAMPFVILVFAIGDLVGVGSSVPISIALGAGDREKADNVFTCAVLLIVALGAILGAAFWLGAPAIMAALGARGQLAEMAVSFLRVYAACAPLTSMMFAVDNYLRICGHIRASLLLNLFMAVFGGVAEFSLLFYLHLGTFGAALGYCLALMVSAVAGMLPFIRGHMLLRFVRPRLTIPLVVEVFAAGMPALLDNVAGRVSSVLLNAALLSQGGEQAVAVYGMLMYASGVVFPLIYGTCDALQPAVGYNWGAGHVVRVIQIERWVFAAAAVISVTMATIMFLAPDQLTRLFIAEASAVVLDMAHTAFRLFSIAYLLRWLPMATQSLHTAIERPRPASTLSLLSALVAPVAALFALGSLGLNGLWLNLPVATVASGVVAAVMLARLRRELQAG